MLKQLLPFRKHSELKSSHRRAILSFFHALPIALNNPFPSFHPLDLLIGILCGAGLRLAVYLKGKNAKKYRHNVEYGRLAPFDIQEVRDVTAYDELQLDTLGDKKTALFLIMSDTDATFNFLISMI